LLDKYLMHGEPFPPTLPWSSYYRGESMLWLNHPELDNHASPATATTSSGADVFSRQLSDSTFVLSSHTKTRH
jgi:hypothetical protein